MDKVVNDHVVILNRNEREGVNVSPTFIGEQNVTMSKVSPHQAIADQLIGNEVGNLPQIAGI